MEIAQELHQFFAQTREISPYDFAQSVDVVLQRIVGEGGECDAGGTDRMREIRENSYGEVTKFLVQHELHAAAALMLQRWWNELGQRQRRTGRHFVRAMAGQWLSTVHLAAGNRGTAYRWSLLTHADDILGRHPHTTEQGDRLEELASYLFSLLPGCVPQRTTEDEDEAFESNVIVRNLYHAPNLLSDLWRYVIEPPMCVACSQERERWSSLRSRRVA